MMAQPGAADNNAAVIIHALIRNSKEDRWAGEIDDLLNEHCMAHRAGYFRNDHAPEMPHGHGRRGGAKTRDRAY